MVMIAGLDSSLDAPSANDALTARAGGIRLWNGYIATMPNVGLEAPWTQLAFENARLCGGTPVAFCSGWDNPAALRSLAEQWNVRLCLDCEDGIRGPGSWVQEFIAVSGAGLYGLVHTVQSYWAPFKIAADYPGFDPQSVYPVERPPVPCGWQWQGTHSEFGRSVDRGWYDAWFALPEISARVASAAEGTMLKVNYNGYIHRMWITTTGAPVWEAITGGSGGEDSQQQVAGTIGSPPAGVTAVPGTMAVCDDATDVPRLSVECLWSDGATRQAVVLAQSPWTVLEDWSIVTTSPQQASPATGNIDVQLRAYMRGAPQ